MNDIFDYDFFNDAIEDVDMYDDDYDDAYEDVDMFDENYFEANEGSAREYRHKHNQGKSGTDIQIERESNYQRQTSNRGVPRFAERDINMSRMAENARLRGEGVYGYQQYRADRAKQGKSSTAAGYVQQRKELAQKYGFRETGPYDTLPEYNKRMGIKNGVVKPAK